MPRAAVRLRLLCSNFTRQQVQEGTPRLQTWEMYRVT